MQRSVATEEATINNQLDRAQHSVALRISKKWLSETLESEVASIISLARFDPAVRPKATDAITDRLGVPPGSRIG